MHDWINWEFEIFVFSTHTGVYICTYLIYFFFNIKINIFVCIFLSRYFLRMHIILRLLYKNSLAFFFLLFIYQSKWVFFYFFLLPSYASFAFRFKNSDESGPVAFTIDKNLLDTISVFSVRIKCGSPN